MPMVWGGLVVASFAATAASMKCPGSGSFIHASCEVQATAAASCADVLAEMQSRVAGQWGTWHDPHNNGTYAVINAAATELLLTRKSGSKSFGGKTYTDKVLFTFTPGHDSSTCSITGCSESQGFSVGDFSTNYCNIRNLYCGSADGCTPVKHDFSTTEQSVSPSLGASKDASACVVKEEAPAAAVVPAVTSSAGPCCDKPCTAPLKKFFSTDAPHGFCGEACMDPSKFSIYHFFESNLTLATTNHPCRSQKTPSNTKNYTDYFQTVTHGGPGLHVTLDLYAPTGMPDHSCCVTPLLGNLTCWGIPFKGVGPMFIYGTGPYCCPSGATSETPCSKSAVEVPLMV